jgi:hypothetical protein
MRLALNVVQSRATRQAMQPNISFKNTHRPNTTRILRPGLAGLNTGSLRSRGTNPYDVRLTALQHVNTGRIPMQTRSYSNAITYLCCRKHFFTPLQQVAIDSTSQPDEHPSRNPLQHLVPPSNHDLVLLERRLGTYKRGVLPSSTSLDGTVPTFVSNLPVLLVVLRLEDGGLGSVDPG